MPAPDAARRLLPFLYVGAALLLTDQAFDLVATLLAQPVELDSPEWRFGAVGLLVTRASVLLVADVLLFAGAVALDHRRFLRVLGVAHLVLAVLLLAGSAIFVLDAVQVRRAVRDETRRAFDLAAFRAFALTLLGAGLLGWAGLAAVRTTRRKAEPDASRIVVARTGSGGKAAG